jgi:hypothetical protein
MNVPTITMPRDEAQARLDEYYESVSRRADAEHEAAVQAYEALAAGTPLLSLQQAFRRLFELEEATPGTGFDEKHRPRIAVARADRQQVRFRWNGTRFNFDTSKNWGDYPQLIRNVDVGQQRPRGTNPIGYALVPMIPADVRNRMSERGLGGPRKHFILWDVEAWSDRRIEAEPDRDPLLLLPIGDAATTDLYAVVDEWDLTEVERYIMLGRREA